MDQNLWLLAGAVTAGIMLIGIFVMITRFFRNVHQGQVLIINRMSGVPKVTFSGGIVWPVINRAEYMDISVKTIEIDRRGKEGLICKDNIRADIKVTFFVRVNNTTEDVMRVAQAIGCVRASDEATLEKLFAAKFSEALKTAGKQLNFEELYTQREDFRDQILKVIGTDLNGYHLEDAAIDFLEQTPLILLDENNILDAQGRRKIIELTAVAKVRANELQKKEEMDIGAQNLQAQQALFEFEQRSAEAEAKKIQEVESSRARGENEARRIRLEEEKQTALKNQQVEEEVRLAEEAKLRAIAVAQQARMREIGVEEVRVAKAKDLEQVDREREVVLRTINKEKALEAERKDIADITRARIAVERTVAEEEEGINDLRAKAAANRQKEVVIIGAEAQAQEILIKDIKRAEAEEQVAKLQGKKQLTLAEAALEASDKEARAKIRMSEGIQAEEAALGLAAVRVKEAEAVAIEKQGLAQVKVREGSVAITEREGLVQAQIIKEKYLAEAAGDAEKGLARAKVQEAEASALEKKGLAEAKARRELLLAEAAGKEADAAALEKHMTAEAAGLLKKAEAMHALDAESRGHEEFRLRLEKHVELMRERFKMQVEVADKQAVVLASAMENARINIVGGDGAFFERFINAVSVGQSIDATVDQSQTVQALLGDRLKGEGDLIEDLKQMVGGISSESAKNLAISALLTKLMTSADGDGKAKLQALLGKARELGL